MDCFVITVATLWSGKTMVSVPQANLISCLIGFVLSCFYKSNFSCSLLWLLSLDLDHWRPIHTRGFDPGSFCTCQYTRGSVFKFAQFAPGARSQIFNPLNIVEHFAGWKFCSRGWSIPMKSLVHTEELCSQSVPLEHAPGAKSLLCIRLNTRVADRGGNRAWQRSQVGSRKLEVGSWKWEVGSWKSEVGNRKSEVRSGWWEVGSKKWEVGGQKSNHAAFSLNGQKSEIRSSNFVKSEVWSMKS